MSNNLNEVRVWLVGAGTMAREYARVLTALKIEFLVIGRGERSASEFESQIEGIKVHRGGIQGFLKSNSPTPNTRVIISVGTESLMDTLEALLNYEWHSVLMEKPGAISAVELLNSNEKLGLDERNIFVAYNRRFYNSVNELEKRIKLEGGVKSFHFDFTEWSHSLEKLSKPEGVKENWLFANSTHVIDLAFYLCGEPKEWSSWALNGTLTWHENSRYVGAGITKNGSSFTYNSNWESAGRWNLEICTQDSKYILCPLEKLKRIKRGEVIQEEILVQEAVFKEGMIGMISDFVTNQEKLKRLEEQVKFTKEVILKMIN